MAESTASYTDHGVSTTLAFALGGLAAAVIAILGDGRTSLAAALIGALVGLIPWALLAGGVRLPVAWFAVIALGASTFGTLVGGSPGGIFPAMIAITWIAASTNRLRILVPSIVTPIATIVALGIARESFHETGVVYFAGGIGISTLAGTLVRRQRRLTDELQAMHDLRIEHAAAGERARIARDVHDIVAHSLTVVMLHVSGARRVLESDPCRAADALERAESVGRESLDSIRQVVGLLRSDDAPGGRSVPSPGIDDLGGLIDGYRVGGLRVRADIDPCAADLDRSTQLVAYRVVQESLSNVAQHAGAAPAEVIVECVCLGERDHLDVTVVNAAPASTSSPTTPASGVSSGRRRAPDERAGLGIRGMVERVRALGGTVEAAPTSDGGWRVAASIPMRNGRPANLVAPTQPTSTEPNAPTVPAT